MHRDGSAIITHRLWIDAFDGDLLIPVANIADGWGRVSTQWFAIGRLAAGVTPHQAQAEMPALAVHLSTTRPGEATTGIRLPQLAELTVALGLALLTGAGLLIKACGASASSIRAFEGRTSPASVSRCRPITRATGIRCCTTRPGRNGRGDRNRARVLAHQAAAGPSVRRETPRIPARLRQRSCSFWP